MSLDPEVAAPVIALTDRGHPLDPDPSGRPYLFESRWPVRGLTADGDEALSVSAEGFGPLAMTWIVPRPGRWRVRIGQDEDTVWSDTINVGEDRRLTIDAGDDAEATVEARIWIEQVGD